MTTSATPQPTPATATPQHEIALPTPSSASQISRCLTPLLDALGWRGDQTHLRAALPHMPEEMGMGELLNTMANLRFESREHPTRMSRVDKRLFPCLFVSKGGDAYVLLAHSNHDVLVFEGISGEYKHIALTSLAGQAIYFSNMQRGGEAFLEQQRNWFQSVLARFNQIFRHILGISLISTVLALMSPFLIMAIYDGVLSAGSTEMMFYISLGVGLFIIADVGFRYFRAQFFNFISVRLGNITGNEILRRILYLPPAFTESANLGAQVSRLRDFETVRDFFAGPSSQVLFEFPFLVILLAGMAFIGGTIIFIPLATMVLFILLGLFMMPIIQVANTRSAQAGSEKQAFLVEMLSNLRHIKFLGAAELWKRRYREISSEAAFANFKSSQLTGIVNAVSHAFVMGAGICTMTLGILKVMDGSMSTGALMASMILVWRILAPMRVGFTTLTQIGRIRKSIDQINRLMNMRLESKQEASMSMASDIQGKIALANVSTRYSSDAPPALLNINIEANPGEIVLIVGHDGAGKSTILKHILGLYHPQAGQVLIDGKNVRQMDPVSLRHSIGYAPQGHHFFYGTIAQNLRLSNPSASDEELEEAAWKAQVSEEIRALPEGFQTRIGDHNISQLSASFKRRLSIARVFVRKPDVMLFDEPETGLTEWDISNFAAAIQFIKGQQTVFIVSHAPAFFDIADKVVWMERGRIRKMGSGEQIAQEFLNEST